MLVGRKTARYFSLELSTLPLKLRRRIRERPEGETTISPKIAGLKNANDGRGKREMSVFCWFWSLTSHKLAIFFWRRKVGWMEKQETFSDMIFQTEAITLRWVKLLANVGIQKLINPWLTIIMRAGIWLHTYVLCSLFYKCRQTIDRRLQFFYDNHTCTTSFTTHHAIERNTLNPSHTVHTVYCSRLEIWIAQIFFLFELVLYIHSQNPNKNYLFSWRISNDKWIK